ncbi:hypothetical protein [Brumimicrobium mesophilum]|uniref:hypothetical protein n=1 Tax=Brumimicrobium mesophilum TaxID=392717 RepID=UPI000D142741|nr:hypothetical protein [Brumimicrobium mesophilum]
MNFIKITVLFIITIYLVGCKKENKDDILVEKENVECTHPELPGEYFPAYPNSWWNYINLNNEIVEIEISSNYQDCEGACRPVLQNINKCIQDNSLIQRFYAGQGVSSTIESPIYSTVLDSVLICPISFSTFEQQDVFLNSSDVRYRRKATTLDTTISVNSTIYENVLVMYEFHEFDALHRYYDYFSKDIGLIKRDSVNAQDASDLIEILRLENYHIEN